MDDLGSKKIFGKVLIDAAQVEKLSLNNIQVGVGIFNKNKVKRQKSG